MLTAQYSIAWRVFMVGGGASTILIWACAQIYDPSPLDCMTLMALSVVLALLSFGALEAALSQIILAENGIEKRDMFGRRHRWSYREVAEFEMREDLTRIEFQSGRQIRVWGKMAAPALVAALLHRYCPPVVRDAEFARWTVIKAPTQSAG